MNTVALSKSLRSERWAKVAVVRPDKLYGILSDACVDLPVRIPALGPVGEAGATQLLISGQQQERLALADRQHGCCRSHRPTPGPHVTRHFDPSQITLAHRYPSHLLNLTVLMSGNMALLMGAYRSTIQNIHYRT
jgi:hypothetical protein